MANNMQHSTKVRLIASLSKVPDTQSWMSGNGRLSFSICKQLVSGTTGFMSSIQPRKQRFWHFDSNCIRHILNLHSRHLMNGLSSPTGGHVNSKLVFFPSCFQITNTHYWLVVSSYVCAKYTCMSVVSWQSAIVFPLCSSATFNRRREATQTVWSACLCLC